MTRRRTFLALLGAATAVSADTAGATEDDPASQSDVPGDLAGDVEPAEALLAYIVAQYGDRLDGESREIVLEGIEGSLEAGAAFREVGLENSDEPAYRFSAYRGDRT